MKSIYLVPLIGFSLALPLISGYAMSEDSSMDAPVSVSLTTVSGEVDFDTTLKGSQRVYAGERVKLFAGRVVSTSEKFIKGIIFVPQTTGLPSIEHFRDQQLSVKINGEEKYIIRDLSQPIYIPLHLYTVNYPMTITIEGTMSNTVPNTKTTYKFQSRLVGVRDVITPTGENDLKAIGHKTVFGNN